MKRIVAAALFLLLVAFVFARVAESAAGDGSEKLSQAKVGSDLFEKVSPSIVAVEAYDKSNKLLRMGSGVVVPDRPNQSVATNCRVVEGASRILVRGAPATIYYGDRSRDVCILSVSGMTLPAATLGSTKRIEPGAQVFAIGYRGKEQVFSEGTATDAVPVAQGKYIRVAIPMSREESGGGVFDEKARLLGLMVLCVNEGNQVRFVLPVEWVAEAAACYALSPAKSLEPGARPIAVDLLSKSLLLREKQDWTALIGHSIGWTNEYPLDPAAWCSLGTAYGRSGQTAKAIEALEHAVQLNREDEMAWYNLGLAHQGSGTPSRAIEAYVQAVQLNPKNVSALYNLAVLYLSTGQEEAARGICRTIETLDWAEAAKLWRVLLRPRRME